MKRFSLKCTHLTSTLVDVYLFKLFISSLSRGMYAKEYFKETVRSHIIDISANIIHHLSSITITGRILISAILQVLREEHVKGSLYLG